MRLRTFAYENAVVVAALAVVGRAAGLPPTAKTFGWALGVFAAHCAASHAVRLIERQGRRPDWLSLCFGWAAGLGAALGADAPARVLLLVPLSFSVLFAAWRWGVYRRCIKPLSPPSWSRDDD